ncbi:MAG: L-ascorbate lactonase UlaG [Candidatus Alkanophagales archaeon MCA70_species_1]|nr:L-ascorbate lactonase UlaG [Candidatus Alkanophaga volatiphilum]
MKIIWHGHACFEIISEEGKKIVTDPFDESIGYPRLDIAADVVLVSHEHYDHNNVAAVRGRPEVVRGAGEHVAKGIKFYGVKTYHDAAKGAQRGENTVFVFEVDGVTLCHLGDLGHVLEEEQLNEIRRAAASIDVLFVPVGGTFTIDAGDAEKVISQLSPKIVVPMHFKTPPLKLPISGVEPFLKGKKVRREKKLEVTKETLPAEMEVVVLDWRH